MGAAGWRLSWKSHDKSGRHSVARIVILCWGLSQRSPSACSFLRIFVASLLPVWFLRQVLFPSEKNQLWRVSWCNEVSALSDLAASVQVLCLRRTEEQAASANYPYKGSSDCTLTARHASGDAANGASVFFHVRCGPNIKLILLWAVAALKFLHAALWPW